MRIGRLLVMGVAGWGGVNILKIFFQAGPRHAIELLLTHKPCP